MYRPFLDSSASVNAAVSMRQRSVWHQRFEIAPGIITPGVSDVCSLLERLELPEEMRGLRVLDVGACDGFFSFECERRGAEVIAVDYKSKDFSCFALAAQIVGSNVRHIQSNVYDLDKLSLGNFDIVLFLGVLYHLQDPMRALRELRKACSGTLYVETASIDNHLIGHDGTHRRLIDIDPALEEIELAQFYPGRKLDGTATNYWAPNGVCLEGMLREAEFAPFRTKIYGRRAIAVARAEINKDVAYYNQIHTGLLNPGMRE